MSFQPLKEGSPSTALLGIAANQDSFTDISRNDDSYQGGTYNPRNKNLKYTLIVIVISAIIFVTIVSIYDTIRTVIKNYYAKIALTDPMSNNTKEDIDRTIVSNHDALKANFFFSLFCLVTGIILIWILLKFL